MSKKIFLSAILFFSIVLFIKIVEPLSVTCKAGGPYTKNSTENITINVVGRTNDVGTNAANISVNLTKSGTLITTRNTTSDSSGKYILSINESLDVGTYAINISAEKAGVYAYCNNTTQVVLLQSTSECKDKDLQIDGIAIYASTGQPVPSGIARISILDETSTNQSSFTDGQFSVTMSGCLTLGKRYILQILIDDNLGKKSLSYMLINW